MKRRRNRYLAARIFDKCARFIIKARRERRYFQKLAQGENQGVLRGTRIQTFPLSVQANQVGTQAPLVSRAAIQSAETSEGGATSDVKRAFYWDFSMGTSSTRKGRPPATSQSTGGRERTSGERSEQLEATRQPTTGGNRPTEPTLPPDQQSVSTGQVSSKQPEAAILRTPAAEVQIPETAASETTHNRSEDDMRIINEVVERELERWGGAILQVEKVLQNKISYADLSPEAKEIWANLLRVKKQDLLRWNETRINQIKRARQKAEAGGVLTKEEQEALADFNAVRGVLKMALLRKFDRIKNRDFGEAMNLINKIKAIASNEPIELTEEDFSDIKAAIKDLEGKTPQEWIQRAPVEEATAPISPEEKKNLFTLFSNMSPLAKLAVFSGVPLMLVGFLQAASGKDAALATGLGAILFALGIAGPEKLFGGSKTASRYFRSHLFV